MSTSNKIAENVYGNENKKRKLSDMLGPQWSKQELDRFYEAYCKYGKDWEKVATEVCNRSAEMVEALYSMNEPYLSLPEGSASLVGLVATMADHYGVLTVGESGGVVDAEAAIYTERPLETRSACTSELPELKMQLSDDNHFPARVTIRSSINVVRRISACLSEHEKRVFRSYAQLGHFIDLPHPWEFFGQLAHYLILRKLETTKENEVWFSAEGKHLRFSLAEFVLVSGLNAGSYPSNEEISKRTMHHRLRDKYFNGQEKITVEELGKKFEEMESDQPGSDKIKIGFVYLLFGFLVARDPRRFISPLYLQLVDDLSFFNMYPWGRVCYNLTLKYLQIDMKHKWLERCRFGKTAKENLNFYGCPHLFQVWAFEAVPRIGELFGHRLDGDQIPRFLRWKTKNVGKNALHKMVKEAMQDSELIVHPILTPSEEELLYYSDRGSFDDCTDDLIDRPLTMSLSDDDATPHGAIVRYHGEDETPKWDVDESHIKQERVDLAAGTEADPSLGAGGSAGPTRWDGIATSFSRVEDERPPREAVGPRDMERERVAREEREPAPERGPDRAGIVDELKSYVDSQLEVARWWHEAMMRRMDRQEDLARQRHHEVMRRIDYIVEHLVRRGG